MTWMCYRHKFASHASEDWQWVELGDVGKPKSKSAKEAAVERCKELADEYGWSDKYRGLDYELFDLPPRQYVTRLIKSYEEQIKSTKRYIEALKRLEATIPPTHLHIEFGAAMFEAFIGYCETQKVPRSIAGYAPEKAVVEFLSIQLGRKILPLEAAPFRAAFGDWERAEVKAGRQPDPMRRRA